MTTATTMTHAGVPDLAQIAAIDFTPDDPAFQTVPSAEEWDRLHFAVAAAAGVLSKTKMELQDMLVEGDADGLPSLLIATMSAAGESFGAMQTVCVAAEARIFIAAAELTQGAPTDA